MRIEDSFGSALRRDEPLGKHANYRIGGPADYYLEVATPEAASGAIRAAREDHLPIFVLGGGSNILISDAGFRGLVLVYTGRGTTIEGERVIADAGAITAGVAKRTAQAGLTGFEWAVGVPGTIGGAARGNAGCFGGETREATDSIEAVSLTTGERRTFMREDCGFAYRESRFKREPWLIVRVTLALAAGDRSRALAAVTGYLEERKGKQPLEYSSAGCIFKNFEFTDPAELPSRVRELVPREFLEARRIPAGWLIDRAELKGKRIGDAMVSDTHGNFFVNAGSATAEQVVQLISFAKMKVRDLFGVQLMEEIQYVGF